MVNKRVVRSQESGIRSAWLLLLLLTSGFCLLTSAIAQQPQTSTAPLFSANAKYVQGVGPGYWPTAGSGLTLDIAAGTAFCNAQATNYAGGNLSLSPSATNYVFLDPVSCLPNSNTSGFTVGQIPLAKVTTDASTITGIDDLRNWFQPVPCTMDSAGNLDCRPASAVGGYMWMFVTAVGSGVKPTLALYNETTGMVYGDIEAETTDNGVVLYGTGKTTVSSGGAIELIPGGSESVFMKRLDSIRFASQYAGNDLGAKINAADADLGTSAGEIWVSRKAGTTSSTPITLQNGHTLRFIQGGVYTFTAGITVQQGGSIIGSGGFASRTYGATGTVLEHDFNGDFITWDGSTGIGGQGGGVLKDLALWQVFNGDSAGVAVTITGTSTELRAGWVTMDNVHISAAGSTQRWTRNLVIDGSVVGGTDGVRDFTIIHCRFLGAAVDKENVLFKNVKNAHLTSVWISGGNNGTQLPGMTITGSAGALSGGVDITNSALGTLRFDWAEQCTVTGGAYTAIENTANTAATVSIVGPRLSNSFVNNAGSGTFALWYDQSAASLRVTSPIALPNSTNIAGRNTTGTANINIARVDSSNRVYLAPSNAIFTGTGLTQITGTDGKLRASALDSGSWAAPGTIGGSTPNKGSFTQLASTVNTVAFSTTPSFDASLGNTQEITLTDNVTSSTLANASAGQQLEFIICQDATGGRTFTWPSNVKGAMTIGTASSTCSAQNFIFDGTNAYALSPGVTDM
jgi:hypothetical protein